MAAVALYTFLIINPRTWVYTVKASVIAAAIALAYLAIRYVIATCYEPQGGDYEEEIRRAPVG